jgi:hypothetical protein
MKAPADRQDRLALADPPDGAFDLIGLQEIGSSEFKFRRAALRVLDDNLNALLRGTASEFGKIGGENLQTQILIGLCIFHLFILRLFGGVKYRA